MELPETCPSLVRPHSVQRYDPVRILVDGCGVVARMHYLELTAPEIISPVDRVFEISRTTRALDTIGILLRDQTAFSDQG